MLRVLTLSTLFPNAAQPTLGVFVERQTLGLAALPDVAVEVVSPLGLPSWPASLHGHYAARAKLPEQEEWKGLTLHRPRHRVLPLIGHRLTPAAMARALLPRLRAIRQGFPFDVIDAEFFWPDGPAAVGLSRALGVPVSIKARGADIHHWGRRRGTARQVAGAGVAAHGLLAVSEALKRDMAELGMPEGRIKVHYTGIDRERFRPCDKREARRRLGLEGPLIVTVGALIERKGQALAIEAIARLPGTTLLLVGDGPDRAALERLAGARGVQGRVRFLGARPHAEIPGLIGAADVMLLPCRSEGLANVWVEALACGTAVVTSDIAGAREAIPDDAGRLVPRDPAAIADAVKALLADPPEPDALERAASRFSWERNSAELRDHLLQIAARGRN